MESLCEPFFPLPWFRKILEYEVNFLNYFVMKKCMRWTQIFELFHNEKRIIDELQNLNKTFLHINLQFLLIVLWPLLLRLDSWRKIAASLISIKCFYICHFLFSQEKVKQLSVWFDTIEILTFWNNQNTSLNLKTEFGFEKWNNEYSIIW